MHCRGAVDSAPHIIVMGIRSVLIVVVGLTGREGLRRSYAGFCADLMVGFDCFGYIVCTVNNRSVEK
ncbi:hypothetical protein P280DRAFT_315893 [Massarina eburnea CBS 473.64]|uniref:Uncharacterized protein n=1 Tax=Massarina eburnea CBS 473.64 TaxID=1395130 RepID=A0A6A6S116_9PLEO|nr:hypothetical protein P280DRAFT_315893 [Massarina eburnea CBS 473.64]